MNIFAWFRKEVSVAESNVLGAIVNIKQGIALTNIELTLAFKWIDSHKASIALMAEQVATIVAMLAAAGVGIPPGVMQSINLALTGVGAVVKAQDSGATNAETLIASYVALKEAYNALNNATVAVAQIPVVKTA